MAVIRQGMRGIVLKYTCIPGFDVSMRSYTPVFPNPSVTSSKSFVSSFLGSLPNFSEMGIMSSLSRARIGIAYSALNVFSVPVPCKTRTGTFCPSNLGHASVTTQNPAVPCHSSSPLSNRDCRMCTRKGINPTFAFFLIRFSSKN